MQTKIKVNFDMKICLWKRKQHVWLKIILITNIYDYNVNRKKFLTLIFVTILYANKNNLKGVTNLTKIK